ncbi:MAG: UTP--glucose-1-phosphate uridylyltransferase GalU [Patescibacteria group bacterium]
MVVTKALITAAGYGTRFLPATKNVPKELLPILDMPVLEYVTEECVQSGIRDIIIVTRYGSSAIEDYFDSASYLEDLLMRKDKLDLVAKIKHVYKKANFVFVRQNSDLPYGTASPFVSARNLISQNENFAFLYGDDVFLSKTPALSQVILEFERTKSNATIGAFQVPESEVHKYGVFGFEEKNTEKILKNIIEKPKVKPYPSNLINVGRHVYSAEIYDYIDKTPLNPDDGNEFQITTSFLMMAKEKKVTIKSIDGEFLTTGDPVNMLRTNLKVGLARSEFHDAIANMIKEFSKEV